MRGRAGVVIRGGGSAERKLVGKRGRAPHWPSDQEVVHVTLVREARMLRTLPTSARPTSAAAAAAPRGPASGDPAVEALPLKAPLLRAPLHAGAHARIQVHRVLTRREPPQPLVVAL